MFARHDGWRGLIAEASSGCRANPTSRKVDVWGLASVCHALAQRVNNGGGASSRDPGVMLWPRAGGERRCMRHSIDSLTDCPSSQAPKHDTQRTKIRDARSGDQNETPSPSNQKPTGVNV